VNVLFVHQNFPGQFRHLAPALVARGDRVAALHMNDFAGIDGVRAVRSRIAPGVAATGHRWTRDFEAKVIRGEATLAAACALAADGFVPDGIVAHPGWGESLFLKQLWPAAKLGLYCEYYYRSTGGDVGFDPEFPAADPLEAACRLQVRNASTLLHCAVADGAIAPTHWQAASFPSFFRDRIAVIHDGIDTDLVRPGAAGPLRLGDGPPLGPKEEVITFVARNLEPYRGYHVVMRALPELLRRRPQARIVFVGGDGVSYGVPAPDGQSWMSRFLAEVAGAIDRSRVHFLGRLPYASYRALLRRSTVHLYLTYPFVLSWSVLEAMATGCAIVASDTAPVREAISHGETGLLFPFFDRAALIESVCALLDSPAERARLGAAARAAVIERFDLRRVCLPRQLDWIDGLIG
jgi:glycosyltransferase involved in cell wall biosynthesis